MTGREPMSDATLDRLLGELPAPEIPAGLALRIVANAAALPQHKQRETVIAAVAPTPLPLARQAAGSRVAGILTFAAAACLALVLIPLAGQRPADIAVPSRNVAAKPSSALTVQPVAQTAEASPPPASRPIRVRKSRPQPRVEEQAAPDSRSPALALPVQEELARADGPSASLALAPDLPSVAQAAGPKAPVQGPPMPIDTIPANGRSTQGLGVVGGPAGGIPGQR